MKYFDPRRNCLVFIEEEASPSYWDAHWDVDDFENTVKKGLKNPLIISTTRKFIPPDETKRILEGGCGNGQFVYAFHNLGYDAYGIDFAEKTISKIQSTFPALKVGLGDVRNLEFPDEYFDGYWSIGVIEHFYEGYDTIIKEMSRVIKPGGFLFITFPHISPLRRLKIRLGRYPIFSESVMDRGKFFQFAFDHNRFIKDVEQYHFTLKKKKPYAGTKGLKDEVGFLKDVLQKIYDSKNFFLQVLNYGTSLLFSPFSSHSILLVFQNTIGLVPVAAPVQRRSLRQHFAAFWLWFFSFLNNLSYKGLSYFAIQMNNGIHPKHQISDYHTFFVNNVTPTDSVLDVGYGNGFVAYKIAQKARKVTGIDIVQKNNPRMRKALARANIHCIQGDATTYHFQETFDVIVLSNVLEHIDDRSTFLLRIKNLAPKMLIRVPLLTRDWVSVFKKEQGLSYKLDNTHHIEYTEENFKEEMERVGMRIESSYVKFGELYAIVCCDPK